MSSLFRRRSRGPSDPAAIEDESARRADESRRVNENAARRDASEDAARSQAIANETRRQASDAKARSQLDENEARRLASDAEARRRSEENEARRRAQHDRGGGES